MKIQRKSNLRQNISWLGHFAATVLLTVWMFATVQAAPGDLDPSFGNGGIVTTPIIDFPYYEFPSSMLLQPDGKTVAGGRIYQDDGKDFYVVSFFLARYNPNGALDASFGTGGKIVAPISLVGEYLGMDIALQPDGKIITVGETFDGKFIVYRYNSDGTHDASFGSGGKVITLLGNYSYATEVEVQPDGKIVVAGSVHTATSFGTDFGIVRYNANGSLDTSFGAGGKVITSISIADIPAAIVLQPDGKIVAAGQSQLDFALVRYNPNGSLDSSFGTNGIITHRLSSDTDYLYDADLQPDGKIVVVGAINFYESSVIVRYNANGSIDTSFAANGIFTTLSNLFSGFGIAVQPNGKIVSFGRSGSKFAILRLNPNGAADAGFGAYGRIVTPIAINAGSYSVKGAIQPNGKIVAFGRNYLGNNYFSNNDDIVVVRYLGGDSADLPRPPQFDFDGDRRADVSVFRPSNGAWYLNRSSEGFSDTQFGFSTDKITPADFDGDGKTDIAVFRDGTWYLLRSAQGFTTVRFGQTGDIPQPADFTGDGQAELAVYRGGNWFTYNLANNQFKSVQFGIATDKPVASDYDGDNRADYAVYRDGIWYLNQSTQGFTTIQFGLPTDKLIPADYDGDGKTDVAVYRDGNWYLLQSQASFSAFQFGLSTDVPAPADYDGDGKSDAAVFRDGTWYLRQSANGFAAVPFGLANDKPIPTAFRQ